MIRYQVVAFFTRFYPFLSGCGTLANARFLKKMSGTQTSCGWAKLHNGLKVFVPFDDYIGRAIYFVGDLDRKVSTAINRLARQGDTVIDIGANLGLITMQLTKLVGENGKVFAFEHNPHMLDCLKQTIEKNAAKNIKLFPFALGDFDTELSLHVPDDNNNGRATLTNNVIHENPKIISVPVKKLSDVTESHYIQKVRLLKIDVEGFEIQVFEGGKDWLSENPPDYILLESNGSNGKEVSDNAMLFLESFGYEIYALNKTMLKLSLHSCDASYASHDNANDFIAVQPCCSNEFHRLFFVRT